MPSSYNTTSQYYDFYNAAQKNNSTTLPELTLIQALCPLPATVLDVGVGTGRHALPLARLGYKVIGIDASKQMIKQLQTKSESSEIEVYNANLAEFESDTKFDLIICMWNAICEIAHTPEDLLHSLQKMNLLLKPNGKVLINFLQLSRANFSSLNYVNSFSNDVGEYSLTSTLLSTNSQTTTCQETVTFTNSLDVANTQTGLLKQTWWTMEQIKDAAILSGFKKVDNYALPINTEEYVVLSKAT